VFAEELRDQLPLLEIHLSDRQVCQLEQHFNLLNRWNKVMNLTSIKDPAEIVPMHYCESLFLGARLPQSSLKICDIGSGAGFPGVPVAILRPDFQVALVESKQRKSVFLREATRELPNARVISKRADQVLEGFDWAVSRAVNYGQIEISLSRLAPNVALLAGEDCPGDRFTWNKIKLPWGSHRFLWLGSST
jgi:16S rRNA (guanine527-N7)-methyltransferase